MVNDRLGSCREMATSALVAPLRARPILTERQPLRTEAQLQGAETQTTGNGRVRSVGFRRPQQRKREVSK